MVVEGDRRACKLINIECDRRSCSAIAALVGWVEERNPTSFFSRQLIYAILDIKRQTQIG